MQGLGDLVKALDANIAESAEMLPFSSDQALIPIKIEAANFHTLSFFPSEEAITAVDGGNAEILSSAQLCLQFIRVARVTVANKKQVRAEKMEFFCLVSVKGGNFKCALFGQSPFPTTHLEFPRILKAQDGTISELEITAVGGMVRRLAELNYALGVEGMLILDGNARSETAEEKKEIEMLLKRDEPTGFLSKTSRLLTANGKSLMAALHELGPKASWWYYPVFQSLDLHVVRLNIRSKYVFALDVHAKSAKRLIETLAQQSNDPVFLGYPYCLIAADSLARVSNEERDALKLRISLQVKGKEKLRMLLSTLDAHAILDAIR